ncbi:class F sortase [Streptomyces sp. NPDC015127]|uniref:class F sortase n=1 Tax=Streptomyces sp. NPDC015127 TaxID=3364939 RepID=UPI0036FC37D0
MPTTSRRASWFTLLCVLLCGVHLVRGGTGEPAGGPPQPAPAGAAARHDAAALLPPAPVPLAGSAPRRVTVPSMGIDAPLTPVGLDANGWVAAPPADRANLAGWYSGAVTPGERGTAVVVGHVDTRRGPAVFHPLGSVARGAHVEVVRHDGRTAVFAVYAVEVFRQRDFPAERVYADGAHAEIRLITCGGAYSEDTGYDGNVVASARLVAVR